MNGSNSDKKIYFSLNKSVSVTKKRILLSDIATVYCTDKNQLIRANNTFIFNINSEKNFTTVVSAIKIIELLERSDEHFEATPLGEPNIIVYYKPEKLESGAVNFLKLTMLFVVTLIGSMFTIMTYNTDVGARKLLNELCELITGDSAMVGYGIAAYSIGLCVGIIFFFNRSNADKKRNIPTPLEVQVRSYEEEICNAVISGEEQNQSDADK